MIHGFLRHAGSAGDRGYAHGRAFRSAVRTNVASFWAAVRSGGHDPSAVVAAVRERAHDLSARRLEEIGGIAEGARLLAGSVLAYDLLRGSFFPDECTVMMAVGSASATGDTIFMKNSDKIGSDSLVGDRFFRHKEINVVVDMTSETGRRIVGVAAAGATGLKMGVNDAGVATGSNIARTTELKERTVDVTQMRAIDRGQVLTDGLAYGSAQEAARWAVAAMAERPTSTPGNVEFADARSAYVIEGSYRHWAVEEIHDRAVIRTNMFTLLDRLNDPGDESSQTRFARGNDLLAEVGEGVRPEDFRRFSQDHEHGPSLNSICRHSPNHEDETSLSAMIVALDGEDPARTRIEIALGKPCWAWNDPEGVLTMTMGDGPESIPEGFSTGERWRRFYDEDARLVRT